MTKVRIPPTLRNEVGGERELVGEGETVREVLEDIAGRYPALEAQLFEGGSIAPFVNVYLGARTSARSTGSRPASTAAR